MYCTKKIDLASIIAERLNMFCSGATGYFSESFNCVDFIIVLASSVDAIISLSQGSSSGALSSLRALRILRMIRLVRSWQGMQRVLRTLVFSVASLGPLCILIALFMYIFALLGMQLFGGKFRFVKTDVPRSNFDSFFPSRAGHGAFLAIFQILSTENWNNIMYCGMTGFQMSPLYAPFFILVMLIGNYMFMNLFISILLQGIGQDAIDSDSNNKDSPVSDMNASSERAAYLIRVAYRFINGQTKVSPAIRNDNQDAESPRPENVTFEAAGEFIVFGKTIPFTLPDHKSFFILGVKSPIRIIMAIIVRNHTVEMFILMLILLSSITLMLERPDDIIVSDDTNCPPPPSYLNCSGLAAVAGQTYEINCPRVEGPFFGKVFQPCNSASTQDVPSCCAVKAKMLILGVMDKVFTLIFFTEMVKYC